MNATLSADKSIGPISKTPVRHSKEDALDNLEFELLVDESYRLKPVQDLEARLILIGCGRLGLRRGELAHMKADWIDWRNSRIEIPSHEPCLKGRYGGLCAHCEQMAQQKTDHAIEGSARTLAEVHHLLARDSDLRLRDFESELRSVERAMNVPAGEVYNLTGGMGKDQAAEALYDEYYEWHLNESLARRWEPKTEAAIRGIPFSFSGRAQVVLERYFQDEGFPQWMYTSQAINRRVDWVSEPVDEIERVTPHTLRATAASYHAGRSLDPLALKAMMGWANLETAKKYIGQNVDNLARKLQFAHQ